MSMSEIREEASKKIPLAVRQDMTQDELRDALMMECEPIITDPGEDKHPNGDSEPPEPTYTGLPEKTPVLKATVGTVPPVPHLTAEEGKKLLLGEKPAKMTDPQYREAKGELPDRPEHGKKYDLGKPRWTLIPWGVMDGVLAVFEYGARKYAPDNWKRVSNGHERYLNAALRHLIKYAEGGVTDTESGLHHLDHAIASLMMIRGRDKNS